MHGFANPLVTVIVPVYNVEKYLKYCLDSILLQTYNNLEIILVNDGSTDDSGDICDNYRLRYPGKIRVIHKKNEGLNFARRDGYKESRGLYVSFVDSDDVIDGDYISKLYNALETNQTDVSICCFEKFEQVDGFEFLKLKKKEQKRESEKSIIMRWLIVGNVPWSESVFVMTAWGKLFRRELIDRVDWDFSNYRANEDELWMLQVFNNINRGCVIIKDRLYAYRQTNNSITQKKYSNSYFGRRMDKFEFINELYEKSLQYLNDSIYADDLLSRFTIQTVSFLDRYILNKTIKISDIKSANHYLQGKIDKIINLPLPNEVYRKVNFIRKYNIWIYVLFHKLRII